MNDHFDATIRLARLIGLKHRTHDGARAVYWAGVELWGPWRPFESEADLQPIRAWVMSGRQLMPFPTRPYTTPAEYCHAVLAAFDAPEPADLTPAESDVVIAELADGDCWMDRAKHFLANGGCPICFSSDESGHERSCPWGQAESQLEGHVEEIRRLTADLATARETNQRLNRRCQQAEAMEGQYKRAANLMRQSAREAEQRVDSSTSWLKRLRRTVHDRERSAWLEAGAEKWMKEAERLRLKAVEVRDRLLNHTPTDTDAAHAAERGE